MENVDLNNYNVLENNSTINLMKIYYFYYIKYLDLKLDLKKYEKSYYYRRRRIRAYYGHLP